MNKTTDIYSAAFSTEGAFICIAQAKWSELASEMQAWVQSQYNTHSVSIRNVWYDVRFAVSRNSIDYVAILKSRQARK